MIRSNGLRRTGGLSGGGLKKSTRPINKYGAIAQQRAERKKNWELEHPPEINKRGEKFYFCHICLYFNETKTVAFVRYEHYVLEHIVPKGNITIEESEQDTNLGPSHVSCNNEKGSLELWQMEKSPKSGLPNPHPLSA